MISNIGMFETHWADVRSKVKQRWSALSDDDLTRINGKADVLVNLLQQKYGYLKERAENEVSRFIQEISRVPEQAAGKKPGRN